FMIRCHSSGPVSVNLALAAWPALLTSTCTAPKRARAEAIAPSTWVGSVTSTAHACARSAPQAATVCASAVASRAHNDRHIPSAARACAIAAPIPRLAPGTTACFPERAEPTVILHPSPGQRVAGYVPAVPCPRDRGWATTAARSPDAPQLR